MKCNLKFPTLTDTRTEVLRNPSDHSAAANSYLLHKSRRNPATDDAYLPDIYRLGMSAVSVI